MVDDDEKDKEKEFKLDMSDIEELAKDYRIFNQYLTLNFIGYNKLEKKIKKQLTFEQYCKLLYQINKE